MIEPDIHTFCATSFTPTMPGPAISDVVTVEPYSLSDLSTQCMEDLEGPEHIRAASRLTNKEQGR